MSEDKQKPDKEAGIFFRLPKSLEDKVLAKRKNENTFMARGLLNRLKKGEGDLCSSSFILW